MKNIFSRQLLLGASVAALLLGENPAMEFGIEDLSPVRPTQATTASIRGTLPPHGGEVDYPTVNGGSLRTVSGTSSVAFSGTSGFAPFYFGGQIVTPYLRQELDLSDEESAGCPEGTVSLSPSERKLS
jgi:hypothetical protein